MSETTTIKFVFTHDNAVEPTKAHENDAAYDLYAAEEAYLLPNERKLVNSGIALEIPEGHAGLVTPRSGLALKYGITVLNSPGLIDPGYRGDIGVILWNTAHTAFRVEPGDRIAQLLFIKTADDVLSRAAWLTASKDNRNSGGFGSTGR